MQCLSAVIVVSPSVCHAAALHQNSLATYRWNSFTTG